MKLVKKNKKGRKKFFAKKDLAGNASIYFLQKKTHSEKINRAKLEQASSSNFKR